MLSNEQLHLIEEMGVYHERRGMSPIPGRILGLFVVSDKDAYTFDEIKEILKISKSATSSALNFLVSTDRIEYTTLPGDRKRYFKWSPFKALENIERETNNLFSIAEMFRRAYELKNNKQSESANNLLMVMDFFNYMIMELPNLYNKWKRSYYK